jgi:hypothetical protein
MSKARTPKPPLITPERLTRLSGKQFNAIQALVEAEDQRRFTAVVLRAGPMDALTAPAARTESAKLSATERALMRQLKEMYRRQRELIVRRHELDLVIKRAHVEPLIGEFVTITHPGTSAERLQPKAGDVGRLHKVDDKRALIDFGDELRTWYIPLWAVGEVKDPFADERPDKDGNSGETPQ